MNSLPIVYHRSTVHEPSAAPSTSFPPLATDAMTAVSGAGAAANENAAAATPDYVTNPLWVIATGVAVFFTLLALLTTSA